LNLRCCPADIASAPRKPRGAVDVDDLPLVINACGTVDCIAGAAEVVGALSSVQDCMDRASQLYTPQGPQWDYFVNRRIDSLCARQIIECDH
jgi:hypothetical protein